jgi:hypothetical protein
MSCRNEDARADLELQNSQIGVPPATIGVLQPKEQPEQPAPGFSSDGQAPWDAQPDVTPAVLAAPVSGVDYGAGYTGTVSTNDPAFLTWLNLKVPNAATVRMILADVSLKDPYIAMYENEKKVAPSVAIAPGGPPELPVPVFYDDTVMPHYMLPEDDGTGEMPSIPGEQSFVQLEPTNMETVKLADKNGIDDFDSVGLMLKGQATDFLNALAGSYEKTLEKISLIAQARADLNAIIDEGKLGKVEKYLRDFNASAYATAPTVEVVKDEVKEAQSSNMMLLIGLALVGLAYAATRRTA